MKISSGNPQIALVEGGTRKVHKTEGQAILEDGEAGLLTFLADKDRISIDSPEPDRKDEMKGLESDFSRDEIEYYYSLE